MRYRTVQPIVWLQINDPEEALSQLGLRGLQLVKVNSMLVVNSDQSYSAACRDRLTDEL